MKKKTTEQFIEEAKKVHGEKYDYSSVEYNGNHNKVKIICFRHGLFLQKPNDHLSGCGCPICGKERKNKKNSLTTEQFIEKAKIVHPNCDYSLVEYKNNKTKVKIICKKHGLFLQTPSDHLNGAGCPFCGKEEQIKKRSSNTENFIQKAKEKYGDKYDYSLVDYKNNSTKVKIICPKHGMFLQTPNGHLKQGCKKCGIEERAKKATKDTEWFIRRAKIIHGDKFDYSLVDYKNSKTKVKIICNKCKNIFEQTSGTHLNSKHGCPFCRIKTTEDFIKEAKEVHPDYDYSLVNYISADVKVKIICPKHGLFFQKPKFNLKGCGCPDCHTSKGEEAIKNYLLKNKINFIPQKTFPDLKDVKLLSYDFYIPSLNLLIEYNGEQHYENTFNKQLHIFHKQKHHDWLKRKYARKNGISLLTIKYNEDIIEKLEEKIG